MNLFLFKTIIQLALSPTEPIDIQKNNFAALSVGNGRKRPIPSLLPCEMNFLKVYMKMSVRYHMEVLYIANARIRQYNNPATTLFRPAFQLKNLKP